MKLSVCFNAFDGVELLQEAVNRVRPVADFVSVVYQTVSNYGESDPEIEDIVRAVDGVDEFVYYFPDSWGGHHNEIVKRQIGLDVARNRSCDYHMTCDVDEWYETDRLAAAYEKYKASPKNNAACKMTTHWKEYKWIIDPPEEYYVPLFQRTTCGNYSLSNYWPVPADPTRRLAGNVMLFERDEIEMRHLSYVRKDIRKKLRNSSAHINFLNRIDEIAIVHEQWEPGKKALLAGREQRWYDVKEINTP
jgi:hypothetical protein